MNERFGLAVIAVDDVLVVIKFMDVAHPRQVVAFGGCKEALVLDDALGNWAATSCTVVVVAHEVHATDVVVQYSNVQRSAVAANLNC